MKRPATLLVILCLFMSLFAGCGANNSDVQSDSTAAQTTQTTQADTSAPEATAKALEGEITFTTWLSNVADTSLKDTIKKFTDANPGVTVETEVVTDNAVMKTRMAANELADVTFLPEFAKISKKDFPQYVQPIDDIGFTADDLYFYNAGVGEDGKLYLITDGIMYDGVVYDKKAFAAAGIAAAPKTREELFAACDKLVAKGIIPFATGFKDAWCLDTWVNPESVCGFTGNPNAVNELANKDILLGDENGNLVGLKLLKEIIDRGYAEKDLMADTWDGDVKGLGSGKYAMMYMASWMPAQLPSNGSKIEDIGMFPMPGVKAVRLGDDGYFGVAKTSKNPEVAKAFLKWLWTEGKYSELGGLSSQFKKGAKNASYVEELLSSGLPFIEGVPYSPEFTAINAKSEINNPKMVQEYVLSKNPEEVVKKYNDIWAKARK